MQQRAIKKHASEATSDQASKRCMSSHATLLCKHTKPARGAAIIAQHTSSHDVASSLPPFDHLRRVMPSLGGCCTVLPSMAAIVLRTVSAAAPAEQ
jgi:hypothetical protein